MKNEIVIESRAAFEKSLERFSTSQTEALTLAAEYKAESDALAAKYKPRITAAKERAEANEAACCAFISDNVAELGLDGGTKSADSKAGTVTYGVKKGVPVLKTKERFRNQDWDEKKAAALLVKIYEEEEDETEAARLEALLKFTAPTIDKSACKKAAPEVLKKFGVFVEKDTEQPFVTLKKK